MKNKTMKTKKLSTGLRLAICIGFTVITAFIGRIVHTVLSIVIGVVVGICVWLFTDFQTGFYSAIAAWILGWFVLFTLGILLEAAVGLFEGGE